MAILDDIEVVIQSNGTALTEYDEPDAELPGLRTASKFIQASAGAKFVIVAKLGPRFKAHGANSVYLTFQINGAHSYCTHMTEAELNAHRRNSVTPVLKAGSIPKFCPVTNGWVDGELAFSNLVVVEEPSDKLDPKQGQKLGTIIVEVRRAIKKKLSTPFPNPVDDPTITEVSEKTVKGRAISHSVSIVDGKPKTTAPFIKYRPERLFGDDGLPYVFKFHYRSKGALQTIGCIPRNPSPVPDPESDVREHFAEPSQGTYDFPEKVDEIRKLRARLEKLEGAGPINKTKRIKAEGSGNVMSGPSNTRTPVKRETDDELTILSSRKRVKVVETIDLTED